MSARDEVLRITASMTVACAIGALVLGGAYVGTERYQRAASIAGERRAMAELFGLTSAPTVTEVRSSLDESRDAVVYDARPLGEADAAGRRVVFALDGAVLERGASPAGALPKTLRPLGRMFVVRDGAAATGFVVEGETRGYKNRIRFLVALTPSFEIAGLRVVEHEEDPGLGAEVATAWFDGQFVARGADQVATLDVTRDPMPEDWRSALAGIARTAPAEWRRKNAALIARESGHPIYAVTGATISSRALTDGVRAAVDHFRRRWALLEPYFGVAS